MSRRHTYLGMMVALGCASCAGWWWGAARLVHGDPPSESRFRTKSTVPPRSSVWPATDSSWDSKQLGDPVLPKEKQ